MAKLPFPLPLLKATALGPGERWITVHPNGDGAKGVPVLIRENPDGSAHVIGGAGGKLTGLRLSPKAPGQTGAQNAQERAQAKKKARAEQRAADKASGLHDAKQAARKELAKQKKAAEREFIAAVAKAKGWDPSSLDFPESQFADLSDDARETLRERHHAQVLAAANAAARDAADRARLDHAGRAEAIGEIPLESTDPNVLSVADIDRIKKDTGGGLGFAANYGKRAEAAGLTAEERTAEKLANLTPEQRKEALAKGEAAALLKEELGAVRDDALFSPKTNGQLSDLKGDLDVLRARKKLQLLKQQAAAAGREVDQLTVAPKAYSLAVTEDEAALDKKVREDVENDLRTVAARTFLGAAGEYERATLDKHIGVGAYNAVNSLALTVTGAGLMDRSVVDVLGIGGAATVLARRLRSALPAAEFDLTHKALEDFHASGYQKATATALDKARQFQAVADSIELPETVGSADDLQLAQDLNQKRREAIGEARRVLGTVLGETEANAALIAAMAGKDPDTLEVSMGRLSDDAAIAQARAIGLKAGDYKFERVNGNLFMTVNGEGMDRLTTEVSREDLAQLKRSQAIIRGDEDEDGWLPIGFANRPDLLTDAKPGVAPRLAEPFKPGPDIQQALRDYIGGRAADGDLPADILADAQSAEFIEQSGLTPDEYNAALAQVVPADSSMAAAFDGYADDFVATRHGADVHPVNKQTFRMDEKATEALHRALSEYPEGVAAFKQVGELTNAEQRALRQYHAKAAGETPEEAAARRKVEQLDDTEPARMLPDAYGALHANSEWETWKTERDAAGAAHDAAKSSWNKFVAKMGSPAAAFESLQKQIRGNVAGKFAEVHNKLNPDSPLRVGRASETALSIGHAAERQLARMMSVVGQNFKPGEPVKLWSASMSGKYAPQQRAIKMLEANKRLGGALGAGSGKTGIMLGAFSHLHGKGKIKRAVMLVPSIVQGQFGGEALRYLQPGKYKWHIEPGASRESRIAAYKDPETHFAVMTHQSFRDDMIHLGAQHAGLNTRDMTAKVNAMSPDERKAWIAGVMEKEGINFDATFVDEAHETVNRKGKANSSLSNVVDAVSDHTPYYGYFSGDPIKNDASEIHSVLEKLDRKRYGDRDEFMRKYGADTLGSKDALRRELSRYVFPNRISSGVTANRKTVQVELTDGQKSALKELDGHFSAAKLASKEGRVDVAAMKAISPGSFEGVPPADHVSVAESLQKSLGIMRSSAERRVINSHPDNAKINAMVAEVEARPGKQGVVFAHARADITAIKAALEKAGKRVVTITGADSAAEKDRKRKLFNPEKGAAQADILLASDAGAVGMNLQSGQYLIQHDIPDTAKTHGQRNARIDRLGQKNNVELIDMVANHRSEFRARDRLEKKYALRELMTSPMEGLDDTGLAYFIKQRQAAAANGQLAEN